MAGKSLREVFDPRNNSLNAIRLVFATAVIVSHSWAVGVFGIEPGAGAATVGFWAVLGFFGISGFLITRSGFSGQPILNYYKARFFRIFPGFVVCIVVVAFGLAPLTMLLDNSASWNPVSAIQYFFSNLALYPPHFAQKGIAETLQNSAYPIMWNGSLWTLFWEAVCYVLVGLAASLLSRKVFAPTVLFCFGAGAILRFADEAGLVHLPTLFGRVLSLFVAFAAGAALFLYWDKVKVTRITVVTAIAALAGSIYFGLVQSAGALPFVFLVIILGAWLPLRRVGSKYDISYGMYIYAWPVQQMVMLILGRSASLPIVIVLSVAGTVPLAYLSCRFIENRARDFGRRRAKKPVARRLPVVVPESARQ